MRTTTLGVIAITSMLTIACTTTEIRTTRAGSATEQEPDPTRAFRTSLALSKSASKAKAIAQLSPKITGAKGKAVAPSLGTKKSGAAGCGLTTGDATCDTCLDARCCAQNTACVTNADCTALVACGDACRDDACIAACLSAHPTGAKLLEGLSTCVETSCTAACGGPSAPPSGGACGFASGDASCDSCLDASCCGDANACLSDADCVALLDCVDGCSDSACTTACEAAHPTGMKKIDALSACATTTCGAACGGPATGGGGGSGPGPASCGLTSGDTTCDACLDGSCCATTTACLGDPDCVALVRCYDPCTDAACAAACDAAHPTGAGKLAAVVSCVETSCTAACGL